MGPTKSLLFLNSDKSTNRQSQVFIYETTIEPTQSYNIDRSQVMLVPFKVSKFSEQLSVSVTALLGSQHCALFGAPQQCNDALNCATDFDMLWPAMMCARRISTALR